MIIPCDCSVDQQCKVSSHSAQAIFCRSYQGTARGVQWWSAALHTVDAQVQCYLIQCQISLSLSFSLHLFLLYLIGLSVTAETPSCQFQNIVSLSHGQKYTAEVSISPSSLSFLGASESRLGWRRSGMPDSSHIREVGPQLGC